MIKKIIGVVILLIPLEILWVTDNATFAFIKSLRQSSWVPYVKILNWFGDGGVLLVFCFVLYAFGHALQWDPQGRGAALKDLVRVPFTKKGRPWKAVINEVLSKLYLFFQHQIERVAFQAATALALDGILARILKFLVGRPRPSAAAQGINTWGPSLTHHFDSFPSGHATSAFAFATAVALSYPPLAPPLFIIAILVSLARVYLGHHYFADVYGGALLGVLCGFLAQRFIKAMEKSYLAATDAGDSGRPFLDKEG